MFRRLASETMLSWLFVSASITAVSAVEFVVSDKSSPSVAQTPSPAYPDAGSILDELPDIDTEKTGTTPSGQSGEGPSPATDAIEPYFDALPDEADMTTLPFADPLEHPRGSDNGFSDEDFLGDVFDGYGKDGNGCGDGACRCGSRRCRRAFCGWYLNTWLSQGFTWNPDDPDNNFNAPVTFNDRSNEYQMNQLYVSLGRRVRETGQQWDLGARLDLLYGTDYFFTTARGLEVRNDGSPRWNSADGPRAGGASLYGLAMPQLFAEVYAPILGGINVKVGHFYTTLGYESVMAPENFFYSHAYTMQYGEPFTHTGVLTSFGLGANVRGHFAVTNGWDNWDNDNDKPGYLFGFSWTPSPVASLAATVVTGREDDTGNQDRTVCSIVYTRQLSNRLRYVFQTDIGTETNGELDANFNPDSAKWYGVNNYLFYDINSRLTAGARVEWFRDQDNARVLGIPVESLVAGGNYGEVSLGLNWRATESTVWRPELRWDWSDVNQVNIPGNGMFNDFTERNQFTAAMDMIFNF